MIYLVSKHMTCITFLNNIVIHSCYYNSCNRVSLLRNLHIYLHYGQKWGLMSHDHHNLHNHHPLSSGQGWTGCGGATEGFSKNSARRKGFFSKINSFWFKFRFLVLAPIFVNNLRPKIIPTKAISITLMTSLGTTGETLQLSCLQLFRRRTYSPWST